MGRHESKRHIFLPGSDGNEAAHSWSVGTRVSMPEEKTAHLRRVLRLEHGQEVLVTDGRGQLYGAVFEVEGKKGFAQIRGLLRSEKKEHDVTLILGLPKNNTMDWVLEKAVECGASRIVPVETARSVVKVGAERGDKYLKRWGAIAEAAIEQSERLWGVEIAEPVSWNDFLSSYQAPGHPVRIACFSESREEYEDQRIPLQEFWKAMADCQNRPIEAWIGPEGGFTESERKIIVERGFVPVSLGQQVLRVETAAVAVLWSIVLRRALG